MSELRQNIATREWYVIATERSKRPHDFIHERPIRDEMPYSEKCPFCVGNEAQTPSTLQQVAGDDGRWQIRVISNKFSALQPVGNRERRTDGVYRSMDGFGISEVIIESPLHNHNLVKMDVDHIEKLIQVYRDRYVSAMADPRIETVMIFKNYGPSAGCSMAHPHSQLIATPVVPTHIRHRLESAKRYCDDTGNCVFCDMLAQEMAEKVRMVVENDSFAVFCPHASGGAFESLIMPKRHEPAFENINPKEMRDLAQILKNLITRYYYALGDPDFNYTIKAPPRDESNDKSFHWYIKVMPRLTKVAGFELGSGMYINVTLPEDNARILRETACGD